MVPLLDVDVPLTRDEFDAAARPLVERSVSVLSETLRLSRLAPEQVAGIFLVGGASQMPLVATELHREFGRPPVTIEQPEMVVAEGAVLVGKAVRVKAGHPAPPPAPVPAQPALPAAPSVSAAPVSPGPVMPQSPQLIAPMSPMPVSPMPVSPPMQRRPPIMPQPAPVMPPPVMPPPVYQRPMYMPPPPQVVYVPMPIRPILKGPWSIRWPAGFMTTYGILLYFLAVPLLIAGIVLQTTDPSKPTDLPMNQYELAKDCFEWAAISAVAATLLINGAIRARRPAAGHHWYPLALCLIVAVSNLALIQPAEQYWAWVGVPAAVFGASTVALLLPASRRWMRRPPKLPPSGLVPPA
jgi:hypothetical protein